ncbi:MAG: hypothetical protein BGP25_15415 [Lysobacterales bacterium 63-13]|nr:MAG: hypothetical protein BGP25_15415 [Xanthomonadales bacterium 63-13]
MGSGLLALPAFNGAAAFTGSFFAATLRTTALLTGTRALAALTGAAGFFALLVATGFFGASAFLLTTLAFDFAAAAGFDFTAAFAATFFTGFVAAFGFAAALAAGLARATTLVDLVVVLDFCVDFAISVLTL